MTSTDNAIRTVHGDPAFTSPLPCDEHCDTDCVHHVPNVGWDLSFGSRINFHPAGAGDNTLVVNLNLSDDATRSDNVYRQVTPDQVRAFAHGLLALLGEVTR